MTWEKLLSYNWEIMLPEFTILGVITLLTLLDLFMPNRMSRKPLGWLSVIGVVIAFVLTTLHINQPVEMILYDMFRLDSFATAFKLIILLAVGLILMMTITYTDKKDIPHDGEFYYLFLAATLGAMFMVSSADMITLFIGLELLSISSYIMVGMRKNNLKSNEAAFKYVVLGGIASAMILFGMSYVYGLTGTTNLFEVQAGLAAAYSQGYDLLVYLSFFFLIAGLGFKIAAAPFHAWAGDVYEGAPTSVMPFLSVVSKAAAFALMIRFILIAYIGNTGEGFTPEMIFFKDMYFYLAIIAALSMIIGNTLALRQTNVKRMMAFSSVAQAGYILVPLAYSMTMFVFEQTAFYLLAYLFMTIGSFAIIMAVVQDRNGDEDIRGFAGLYHRAPYTAIAMTIFLLSLAGIPITAGFFGKFYIFINALGLQQYWIAGIMIATSVVSYFYYFGIIRQMYMRGGSTDKPLGVAVVTKLIIFICLIGTIVLGVMPNLVLDNVFNHMFDMYQQIPVNE